MKAIVAHRWCEPNELVLDEVPRPEPGPDEVLIKVRAAALNFPDLLIIGGKYQVKPPLPFSPGFEVAGIVEATGAGAEFRPGQRVLAQLSIGGFAEYAVAPASAVQLIPDQMSD